MARRLAATVIVDDVHYAAGTVPPTDVAKQITNDSAWEPAEDDDEPAPAVEEVPAAPRKRPAKKAAAKAGEPASPPSTTTDSVVAPPTDDAPVEEWRTFATTVGVTPPDDADADAIKAELVDRQLIDQEA